MSIRPYDEYKTTNIQYINKVPKHWNVLRADGILNYRKKVIGHEELINQEVFHYSIPSVEEIGDGQLEQGEHISSSKIVLNGGELLVSKLNPRKSRVIITANKDKKIVCSTEFVPLIPNKENDISFIRYLYLSESIKQTISARVQSATRSHQRAQPSDIYKLWIALPPYNEQVAISTFLENETFKIDNIIEKKQRLIELLQEKRQALITSAVTKGLDPNVPMKDSGIPWLGVVPEHWEMKKLKYITRMVGGSTPTKDNLEFWNGDIPWVSPKDMKVDCIHSSQDYITQKGLIHSSLELVPKNSTLIVVRSGILKHTLPVAITKVETTLNQDMKALIPRSNFLLNEYLFWMFKGLAKSVLDNSWKIGATVDSIETELLDNLLFPIPGQEEQKTIIEYLENRTTNISRLIAKIQTQITKLHEYRQALITAAVTGKIDVCEKVSS